MDTTTRVAQHGQRSHEFIAADATNADAIIDATLMPLAETSPPARLQRIALCVTEDWFALSHFVPLIRALRTQAREVIVVTRCGARAAELQALGVRLVPFDYARDATNPVSILHTAWQLSNVLRRERPDALHVVAHKPIVLAALALRRLPPISAGLHLTGLGHLAEAATVPAQAIRWLSLKAIGDALRRPESHLFIENDDDLELIRRHAADPGLRVTLLGGAGIDADHFAALPEPEGPPRLAYVGRMLPAKGVPVIIEAMRLLRARGLDARIDLYGPLDTSSAETITGAELETWQSEGLAQWHGTVSDVREIWRRAAVFVLMSRREGLPRAMLEAAACARPLVVSDVPGCRRFVRDHVEGRLVPAGDAAALADVLATLMARPDLRRTMGAAARERVCSGFTEHHVETAVVSAYTGLISRRRA